MAEKTEKMIAIATAITILSCKIKNEGYYSNENGWENELKPEFIVEQTNMLKMGITIEDIEICCKSLSHCFSSTWKNNKLLGVRVAESLINRFNSIDIQSQLHLTETE